MVSKAFRKELNELSPWQLTQLIKEWMEFSDARLEINFNWACPSKSELTEGDEDCLWLKKTGWKSYAKRNIDRTRYVKL
jgi:hypothetical protein